MDIFGNLYLNHHRATSNVPNEFQFTNNKMNLSTYKQIYIKPHSIYFYHFNPFLYFQIFIIVFSRPHTCLIIPYNQD